MSWDIISCKVNVCATHLISQPSLSHLIECVSRQSESTDKSFTSSHERCSIECFPWRSQNDDENIFKQTYTKWAHTNNENGRVVLPSVDANEIINHILQISINETRTNDISMCEIALDFEFDWIRRSRWLRLTTQRMMKMFHAVEESRVYHKIEISRHFCVWILLPAASTNIYLVSR